jgi:cytochrome c5
MRQTEKLSKRNALRLFVIGAACLLFGVFCLTNHTHSTTTANDNSSRAAASNAQRDLAASRAAFTEAYKVFMHPRCMNCHPAGGVPLQGDNSLPHAQRVQSGPEGKGIYGMKCNACHQQENLAGEHMPPGAPNWHLPHPKTPMVFEKRTPGQLCRQFKDPKQNGGKSLEELFKHISSDPLVLWGWNPGEGRTKPPLSHAEFVQKMDEWIKKGAACPQ